MQIELLQNHTHQGQFRQPGERLSLDKSSAKWLIDLKVAKAVNPESNKPLSRKGD